MTAADPAPELLSLLLTRDEIQDWRASAYPRGWDRRLADTALDAMERAAELAAKLAVAERERDAAIDGEHIAITTRDSAENRADRAEAALVAAQEAMRSKCEQAAAKAVEKFLTRYDDADEPRLSVGDLADYLRSIPDAIHALPIPAAKPEGE
jgi:hypothetical protein